MNSVKKFIADFKANTNGIRKQTLITLGIAVGSVIAGVVVTKLNDDNTPVLILSEVPTSAPEADTEF